MIVIHFTASGACLSAFEVETGLIPLQQLEIIRGTPIIHHLADTAPIDVVGECAAGMEVTPATGRRLGCKTDEGFKTDEGL